MYPREQYLKEIISKKDNGRIKIITGLRRSGKSVLLFQLYREWLLGEGVKEDQIIALALDILENARYRNPLELDKYGITFSLMRSSLYPRFKILTWIMRMPR